MDSRASAKLVIAGLKEHLAHAKGEKVLTRREVRIADAPKPMTAQQIAALRRRVLKVSQALFAYILNTSEQTVHSWEQGRSHPSGCALRFLSVLKKRPEIATEMLAAND